jgi:hypothetical protein
VAQLVARLVRIEKVRGSIPLSSTREDATACLATWRGRECRDLFRRAPYV